MPITYRNSLRTTRIQAVADDIDSGAGPGTLEICTNAYANILASITLQDPCGSVAGDPAALTLDGPMEDASADLSGIAAIARIKNSDGTIIATGLTVGTADADIIISNTTIVAGQPVSVTSGVIRHFV